MKRIIRKSAAVFPEFILVYSCVYIIVRLTVQDRYPAGRIASYAPALFVAGACLLCAAVRVFRAKRRWIALCFVPVLAVLAVFIASEYRAVSSERSPANGKEISVLSWNIFHGILGWDEIIKEIKRYDADIVVLSEAVGEGYSDAAGFWKKTLPEYEVSNDSGDGDFIVLVRGGILESELLSEDGLTLLRVVVEVDGRRIKILMPHLDAHPFRDSERIYGRLLAEIDKELCDMPVVLTGDFNTPRHSYYSEILRGKMRSAYDEAGRGFACSWPMPIPLWAIDHTFVNDRFDVVSYATHNTLLSDHAAQEIILILKD